MMKRLWKMIIVRQKKIIDFSKKLICQALKQITIWLDEPSCWMRMFVFLVMVICGYLITLFYIAHPVRASGLGALIAALIGGYFLYRRTQAAEQSLNVERLTRAMDQLSNEDLFMRVGGVLSLEQIANTEEDERKKIARVLVSFIRTQAVKNSKRNEDDFTKSGVSKLESKEEFSAYRAQRLDIEAAVNALARIASELEKERYFREEYNSKKQDLCDLRNTDLRGLRFVETDLSGFNFSAIDLSGAGLVKVKFTNAWFFEIKSAGGVFGAKFIRTFLKDVDFSGTNLNRVDFSHIEAEYIKFIKTPLNRVIFIGAQMLEPEFNEANLMNANFMGAVLVEAEMDEATLENVNFTDTHLYETYGLSQLQLNEAFRWKGHNTSVSFTDGRSLEPPPEKGKPAEFESCVSSENGYKWEIYKDGIDEWRWIRTTPGGEIDDLSNEGYRDKADCIANARRHGMDCYPS